MARYGYCPSGRFFEAAACGTPIVSDGWEGLETFFLDGEQVFVCLCSADVLTALNSTDAELARMAARARERTLEQHSGAQRAQELLTYCEQASSLRQVPRILRPALAPQELAS
jgi:spore maturation protein CgeB